MNCHNNIHAFWLFWAGYRNISGAAAREERACGTPWVRKFGKLSIRENLVMTWRTPTSTHTLCKLMSNVTLDLGEINLWGSFVTQSWMRYERTPKDVCGEARSLWAYAYPTLGFQGHITLKTYLREWKLLSQYMFHRVIFILLIVSSLSFSI